MTTQNWSKTETLENDEDRAMQEAEAARAERLEQRVERQDKKSVIPLAIVQWLALQAAKYQDGAGYGDLSMTQVAVRDPATKGTATYVPAERHPDVKLLAQDFPSLSLTSRVRIAWLIWRARQVQFWTRSLNRDTYIEQDQGRAPVLKHKGTNTHSWEACLDAAYLAKDSELHNMAMERRTRFYAKQQEDADELNAIALTLGQGGTAQGLKDIARDSHAEVAQRQANVNAAVKAEAKAEEKLHVQPVAAETQDAVKARTVVGVAPKKSSFFGKIRKAKK